MSEDQDYWPKQVAGLVAAAISHGCSAAQVREAVLNGLPKVDSNAAPAYQAFTIEDIKETNSPNIVQGLVYGLTVIAGGPNAGKSAFEVDLLAHIAAGVPFFGKKTHPGPVLLVAAEAPFSIVQRVRATQREKFSSRRLPLYLVREAPRLGDETIADIETDRLISTMRQIASTEGEAVRILAIDTVAIVLSGADENGPGMLQLVRSVQRIIAETSAAVLLLHHPSKADPAGLRGHSSLQGAADVIIQILADEPSGARRAKVIKSRDGEVGTEIYFGLEAITQSEKDAFGDPIRTVIVRAADKPANRPTVRGKHQQTALAAITEWTRTRPDVTVISTIELHGLLKALGIPRQRRHDVVEALVNIGVLTGSVGGHRVNREALT